MTEQPEAGSTPIAENSPAPVIPLPLAAQVESLLFVAEEPTPIVRLAQVLELSPDDIEGALSELETVYQAGGGRGIRLQRKGDRVQLVTAPAAAPLIERFLGLDPTNKLSNAALETLAVIAYRQPITRAEVEAVRGVSCDGVLRTLVARGLVETRDRLEQAGRPFLYGTTFQFLQYFGLDNLNALPPLPEEEER